MTSRSYPISKRCGAAISHVSALIDDLEARFEAIEPTIEAYLPEGHRFDRLAPRLPNHWNSVILEAVARPPLYGATLGVKDIFHVNGFLTRAGTQVPSGIEFAAHEADVVTRLKRVGALIVGKTVTTEFAYFEPGPTRISAQYRSQSRRKQQRLSSGDCGGTRSYHDRHPDRRFCHSTVPPIVASSASSRLSDGWRLCPTS